MEADWIWDWNESMEVLSCDNNEGPAKLMFIFIVTMLTLTRQLASMFYKNERYATRLFIKIQ